MTHSKDCLYHLEQSFLDCTCGDSNATHTGEGALAEAVRTYLSEQDLSDRSKRMRLQRAMQAYENSRVSTPIPLTPSDEMVEDRLAKIFGAADVYDFARLDTWIPESGHGQFWKHVFFEVRAALNLMGGKK